VEIDTKIIIMGNEHVYDLLYNTDEDFPKLFKVPAEFDSVMDRDEKGTREYIHFIRRISREEELLEFDYSGIAAVIEYAVRIAEFKNKLTTRFSVVADLLREADYWGRKMGRSGIDREIVLRTLEERHFLHNLPEEKIDEQILSGEILMALSGSMVGRINGLAILDRGYYSFGRPLVITARTAPGHDGIINIERESGLSGEIHDKGVLIIEGYLQTQYARDFPLSIRASICFEQSYIEVDGDSASSAEIYALLSAIAELPLRQDLAVTGSVNQMGDIQPVGGISEKIEGFFEICRKTGLTGNQGVIIPLLNMPNLVLSAGVQEAVGAEKFHLFAVSNVDEGMEILTGIPAGSKGSRGTYPPASVNGKVQKRLREMAMQVKDFGGN
jgi:predicted ATP-dependent protease